MNRGATSGHRACGAFLAFILLVSLQTAVASRPLDRALLQLSTGGNDGAQAPGPSEGTVDDADHDKCIESLSSTLDCNSQSRVIDDTSRQIDTTLAILPRLDYKDGLREYTGGFNTTSDHYWTSLAWTGVYGFFIAALVVVITITWFLTRSIYACLGKGFWPGQHYQKIMRRPGCCEKFQNAFMWVVICFVLASALVGIIILFLGMDMFASKIRSVTEVMDNSATSLSTNATRIDAALAGASAAADGPTPAGAGVPALEAEAARIKAEVRENGALIDDVFQTGEVAATVVGGLLCATLALALPGMLHKKLRHVLLLCMFVGFFIVVAAWLCSGLSMIAAAFSRDMCLAMEGYVKSPGNSTLADLVPCVEAGDAGAVAGYLRGAEVVLVAEMNAALAGYSYGSLCVEYATTGMSAFCAADPAAADRPYHGAACGARQGGGWGGGNTAYAFARDCGGQRVAANFSLPAMQGGYLGYKCELSDDASCAGLIPKPLWESLAAKAAAAARAGAEQAAGDALLSCEVTRHTFEVIVEDTCQPLKLSSTIMWLGFLFVADAFSKLMLYWVHHYGKHHHIVKGETRRSISMHLNVEESEKLAIAAAATGAGPLAPPGPHATPSKLDGVVFSQGGVQVGSRPARREEWGQPAAGGSIPLGVIAPFSRVQEEGGTSGAPGRDSPLRVYVPYDPAEPPRGVLGQAGAPGPAGSYPGGRVNLHNTAPSNLGTRVQPYSRHGV